VDKMNSSMCMSVLAVFVNVIRVWINLKGCGKKQNYMF
jgi:hypothetical protein